MGHRTERYKYCCRCNCDKSVSEFYRDKNRKDGRYPWCKKCTAKAIKGYRAKPEIKRRINETRRRLRAKKPGRHWKQYGIDFTAEEYNERYRSQDGQCAVCGIHQSELSKRLCVDHNHDTGQARGLVCVPCNTIIGIIEGKMEIVQKIELYLRLWREKGVKYGMSD